MSHWMQGVQELRSTSGREETQTGVPWQLRRPGAGRSCLSLFIWVIYFQGDQANQIKRKERKVVTFPLFWIEPKRENCRLPSCLPACGREVRSDRKSVASQPGPITTAEDNPQPSAHYLSIWAMPWGSLHSMSFSNLRGCLWQALVLPILLGQEEAAGLEGAVRSEAY